MGMTEQEAIVKIKDQKRLCLQKGAVKVQGITEALDMGIKALEKQIAKKPRKIRDEIYDSIIHYYCPNCGRRFGERGEHNVILFKKELYCQGEDCGQKLDWGNEDD